jgi:hypothetical protein
MGLGEREVGEIKRERGGRDKERERERERGIDQKEDVEKGREGEMEEYW